MSAADFYPLISNHYLPSTNEEQKNFATGQIYLCPSIYFRQKINCLKVKYVSPTDEDPAIFEIATFDGKDFNREPHFPLLKPHLEADEEFVVFRAKLRKVIIVSTGSEPWKTRGGEERGTYFLTLPLFSFHNEPAPFRLRVQAFAYKDLFYFPANDALNMVEGFTRFDEAQVCF